MMAPRRVFAVSQLVHNFAAAPDGRRVWLVRSNGGGTFPDKTGRRRERLFEADGVRDRWDIWRCCELSAKAVSTRNRVLGPDAQIRGTNRARGCHNRHGMRSASAAQLASLFG